MTLGHWKHTSAFSRRDAPEVCRKFTPSNERAWGMPGARCTRSLVCAWGNKYAHEYSQRVTGNTPAFPHAMVLRLIPCSPRRSAFLSPSPCGRWRVAPGRAQHTSARLDAGVEASGPHVFTVRISAVRQHAVIAHGKPALRFHARLTLPRPPHPAPTFVTMANAPLSEQDGVDIG